MVAARFERTLQPHDSMNQDLWNLLSRAMFEVLSLGEACHSLGLAAQNGERGRELSRPFSHGLRLLLRTQLSFHILWEGREESSCDLLPILFEWTHEPLLDTFVIPFNVPPLRTHPMMVVVVFELLVVDIVVVGIVVVVVVNDLRLDLGSHLRDIASL